MPADRLRFQYPLILDRSIFPSLSLSLAFPIDFLWNGRYTNLRYLLLVAFVGILVVNLISFHPSFVSYVRMFNAIFFSFFSWESELRIDRHRAQFRTMLEIYRGVNCCRFTISSHIHVHFLFPRKHNATSFGRWFTEYKTDHENKGWTRERERRRREKEIENTAHKIGKITPQPKMNM